MFWFELLIIFLLIFFGARVGDVFMGLLGGVGVAIFVFIFHVQPASPPVDVMLIILAVVLAASALQSSGGLNFLVQVAEKTLHKSPKNITIVAPIISWLFTFLSGTGHVVYSLLPIINKLAIDSGIRPERPISNSIIASQQAITCSPVSAATAAMLGLMAPFGVDLGAILLIAIPSTLLGVITSAFLTIRKGKELAEDPEYSRRLAEGLTENIAEEQPEQKKAPKKGAKTAVLLFLLGVVSIIVLGLFSELRPSWTADGKTTVLSMAYTIEIVMLVCASLIIIFCRPAIESILNGSIFRAGALAMVCAFGLAWMSSTFIGGQTEFIQEHVTTIVNGQPWMLAVIMFIVAALVTSQGATTLIMIPISIALDLPTYIIVGAWMAVNANFFLPVSAQCLAAISFDTAGTTKIGKYVLNHSFMTPGMINTVVSVVTATLLGNIIT
ncbi:MULTISPECIES: anaerobic C4-dicarboxylate transporter [unclassified Paenibacillus]|uniref:anaerobic C4-dicarboxylate transporter family protein n=1 Tax=unclassified Paenibacillus TaxID=185978 RepID=UPI002405A539|nr:MULTISPECIES: anaerobic C4-dicarboxylate transporter [unclassified Paenibacillus]MDF9839484.1 anaerobic C4-dicarboxylate transporter DcuB [Paenibacillus sp. PastF-2]MDF9846065.1 anaerobic C4-dicarboxylate transporter DcuB [Paenibacillus sp. PastM-2]MDF9852638.1 anaerobic C4-dicarboxylate transporter DcuB [Paenibacillus sp. PastF-1]MDH6477631.1 anaerobic C4-dicarboxylate transporter DcuB [Paenibacillus sp. PastH-2]MDH6505374.1 anaerobic C4-dicarboxylate transporter DcuB [Paenibacillus sp. Pa